MKKLLTDLRLTEPARLAEVARWLLVTLVTTGWLTLDDAAVNGIVSAVSLLLSALLTKYVRGGVTPVPRGVGEHRATES